MRIPLDYYRILGLPIQANPEAINQAYHDRSLQLPRGEYGEVAINARRQLLDEAYAILSDAKKRADYNAKFFEKTDESESSHSLQLPSFKTDQLIDRYTPSIQIHLQQLTGALLILQELAEYDLILKLAEPVLKNSIDDDQQRNDIVLIIALVYLEQAKEYWQQQQYDLAATSAENGEKLLSSERLFPTIKLEIQTELYKLRPYQILELIAQDLDCHSSRIKGIKLLQEMLSDRHGIDGRGDDRSGLNIDDFLSFIQQLRTYLTVEEQLELMIAEAHRPSPVGTYLAVYALIAKGFSHKQPLFIAKAQKMLQDLPKHQDVSLEKAICTLLLGQPEKATASLRESQDEEALIFIQENSPDEWDLLPGLCLYSQNWLKTEVFSQFRDLAGMKVSLKEYFADEEVENYLEEFLATTELENSSHYHHKNLGISQNQAQFQGDFVDEELETNLETNSDFEQEEIYSFASDENFYGNVPLVEETKEISTSRSRSTTYVEDKFYSPNNGNIEEDIQEDLDFDDEFQETNLEDDSGYNLRKSRKFRQFSPNKILSEITSSFKLPSLKITSIVLGLGGIFVIGFLLLILRPSKKQQPVTLQKNPPSTNISIVEPKPQPQPIKQQKDTLDDQILNHQGAEEVIETWLKAKLLATSSEYNVEELKSILAEPLLSSWVQRSNFLKRNKIHYDYEHNIEVEEVNLNPANPNQATIKAKVREIAKSYIGNKIDRNKSYDSILLVEYEIMLINNNWRIINVSVVQESNII